MNNFKTLQPPGTLRILFCFFVFMQLFCFTLQGQEKPPKPISVTVNTLQHLNFGTIIPNGTSGGTVTVDHNGSRSYIGQIILPPTGTFSSPALFEVTALPGTLITIVNGPVTYLSGSNTGTIALTLGPPSTGTPFVATGPVTDVFIGGTLTVQSLSANPAGFYSGSFTVTFIQN
jgi:hypothetical protein